MLSILSKYYAKIVWSMELYFFVVVKLDFEIAVDQQTKAHDQIFERVPDSGCPPVPAEQPRPYLVNFAKSP